MNVSNLFSDEKVNTGRQVELDIAKGLAIIFMIFLHTIMVVSAYNASLSPNYNFAFSNVLGRPFAAIVFMFCMGVGVVYSRHSQWDTMVKRGCEAVSFRRSGKRVRVLHTTFSCDLSGP